MYFFTVSSVHIYFFDFRLFWRILPWKKIFYILPIFLPIFPHFFFFFAWFKKKKIITKKITSFLKSFYRISSIYLFIFIVLFNPSTLRDMLYIHLLEKSSSKAVFFGKLSSISLQVSIKQHAFLLLIVFVSFIDFFVFFFPWSLWFQTSIFYHALNIFSFLSSRQKDC